MAVVFFSRLQAREQDLEASGAAQGELCRSLRQREEEARGLAAQLQGKERQQGELCRSLRQREEEAARVLERQRASEGLKLAEAKTSLREVLR